MSADRIVNKILDDAKAAAAAAIAEAEAAAAERGERAKADAAARAAEILSGAEAEAAEYERRKMLNASLESRKNSLASRRKLLDEAFSLALRKLEELDDEEYAELVEKLVVDASQTGRELLVVPQAHLPRYQKPYLAAKGLLKRSMLGILNDALKQSGKEGGLTLGEGSAAFSLGVILKGENVDLDCSFESLVAAFREEREAEVAALLFGSEV